MTESIEVSTRQGRLAGDAGFVSGEIATLACDRCQRATLPWDLRAYGKMSICRGCYNATLELARGAMRSMDDSDPSRRCSNCRAMRDPALGSAWCSALELGDERAIICANFVPLSMETLRAKVGARVDVIDIWHAVSEELRARLGEGSFSHWFERITPMSLEGNTLVLGAPDDFTRDWLSQRLGDTVRDAMAVAGYSHLTAAYVVAESEPQDETPSELAEAKAAFNPHYTFSEFIVGSGNRLAHASALACVDKPGTAYNPLVLYGGVGVGKTHLLQAIGQEAIDQRRGVVLYATSETFTNELILAIREGSTGAFRERYRNVDYLLIDDIQFIAGKDATQEEFFHTFNALHQAGKQVVVTSDRPPTDLRILEDRLRSRLGWGLPVDLQPPDLETRIAILRSKAEQRGARLPETVLNAIAVRAGSNVRELEGTLNRVLAVAELMQTEPGMDTVRAVLGEEAEDGGSARPGDVLQAVSSYYRIKAAELTGPQRARGIAFARQVAMYLLREESKLSLVEVGNYLGGRNHSTVLYGAEKIAGEARRKGRVRQDLHAIRQLMYAGTR